MPTDYRPDPQHTQPGQAPKPGQFTTYVDDDGNKYPGIITYVGEVTPDGKYYGVGCERIKPGANALVNNPGHLGNPVSTERNGWLYNVEKGKVYYCPCPPPLPDHPCP